VQRSAGIEATGKRDADLLTDRNLLKNIGHAED
jgi:hypothetical protein